MKATILLRPASAIAEPKRRSHRARSGRAAPSAHRRDDRGHPNFGHAQRLFIPRGRALDRRGPAKRRWSSSPPIFPAGPIKRWSTSYPPRIPRGPLRQQRDVSITLGPLTADATHGRSPQGCHRQGSPRSPGVAGNWSPRSAYGKSVPSSSRWCGEPGGTAAILVGKPRWVPSRGATSIRSRPCPATVAEPACRTPFGPASPPQAKIGHSTRPP